MTTAMDETVTIPIISGIPTDAEVADALDAAANVIATNGLMVGAYFDRAAHDAVDGIDKADSPMDALGAITWATCGDPVIWQGASHHDQRLRIAAVIAVQAHLGEGFIGLPEWSDHAAAEDVTEAMRAAAKKLRGEGA